MDLAEIRVAYTLMPLKRFKFQNFRFQISDSLDDRSSVG
jgi:hypothetical protein